MKRIILSLFLGAICQVLYAQTNILPTTGNVGIGTLTPGQKLEVHGNILLEVSSNEGPALNLVNPLKTADDVAHKWTLYNMTGPYGNSLQFWNYNSNVSQYGSKLTLADNGNIGVGIRHPNYKLQVDGDIAMPYTAKILSSLDPGNHITLHNGNGMMKMSTGGQDRFAIDYYGNVGIGTITPNEKLSVNGKIRAHEVKVETANWPDYVFEQDYKILGLQELAAYIKINKHLPEMPSALEVSKNGVELGEMNKLLLKKIEELTIYLIEQNKEINKLKQDLSVLKK